MECQSRVRAVLGKKHDALYPKVLQLVMADGAYCEGRGLFLADQKDFFPCLLFIVFIRMFHFFTIFEKSLVWAILWWRFWVEVTNRALIFNFDII